MACSLLKQFSVLIFFLLLVSIGDQKSNLTVIALTSVYSGNHRIIMIFHKLTTKCPYEMPNSQVFSKQGTASDLVVQIVLIAESMRLQGMTAYI